MPVDAYHDWVSIFTEELTTVWQKEKSPLQKLAMIYRAFQNELNYLKNNVNQEFIEIKTIIKKKEYENKCKKFIGLAQSERFDDVIMDKENKNFEQLKHNDGGIEDLFIESPDTSDFFQVRSPSPKNVKGASAASPVLRKDSFTKPKTKQSNSPQNKTPVVIQPETIVKVNEAKNFRTPRNDDSNIMECSIIEDTPELKSTRRVKPSFLKLKKQKNKSKLSQSKQTNTLTQMFYEPKTSRKKIDSNMASMGISEMINLINESSGSDTDETVDLEHVNTSECAHDDDLDKAIPDNLKSFVENYDKIPAKKDEKPKFAFQEVVRGHARKKLKGWSCKECQDYYEALNLPPDELEKKKNLCSRHRHRFKPRDETHSGFWDLTFKPTPETQDSSDSLVFNFKKT